MASLSDLTSATAQIGAHMTRCEACPCCGGEKLEPIGCRNDLDTIAGVSDGMKDSDYHACLECGLVFARRRQSKDSAALYYQWFAHLERRDYAAYPPPQEYIRAKDTAAADHLSYLADHGVLSDGMTIAHIRCDVGSLQSQIVERFPGCTVHGYDYFESNIRYAREHGLDAVRQLDPACIRLDHAPGYDLIICNHAFTHALDPAADLQTLHAALKPGGVLYLYGEADHLLRFDPSGSYYQWVALNNFHKQLFSPASLENFLTKGGFSVATLDHDAVYMKVLARRVVEATEADSSNNYAEAAAAGAPMMVRKFRDWAKTRDNRFLTILKLTRKFRTALRQF